MKFDIHPMGSDETEGKGKVHYQSWQESYRGLVDDGYLSRMSVEKCQSLAARFPENTVVATVDGQVVGFGCWCSCRDEDTPSGTGELQALYLLDAFKGQGLGRALADYCMAQLASYERVVLWVLAENEPAIGFYRHYGFEADGGEQILTLGAPVRCIRMTKKI